MNSEPNTQYQELTQRPYNEDEIDIREWLIVLWEGKLWILGATFIAAIFSVLISLMLPNSYKAEVLLMVEGEASGGLSSIASQYAGLASFAGISIPDSGSSDKAVAIATLQSQKFISDFVLRYDLLPEVMATKSFDWETGELSYDLGIYNPETKSWTQKTKAPFTTEPSGQAAYAAFSEFLTVQDDTENGLVIVSIEHNSPILAQQWVTWLIRDLNYRMMQEAKDEASRSIEYLAEQLKNTQIVALAEAFYPLIEEQTKSIMLANARSEYIFKTIDPAVVPEIASGPNRKLLAIAGAFIGGLFGLIIVALKRLFRE